MKKLRGQGKGQTLTYMAATAVSTIVLAASTWTAGAAGPTGGTGRTEPRAFPLPLSSELPLDVDTKVVDELDRSNQVIAAQREFDILAWQAFLALNWPADEQGRPLGPESLKDAASPRVWSFWRTADTIFLTDGGDPAPWEPVHNHKAEQYVYHTKGAWRQSVTRADENFQAFSGPLVDQNGKWVRYEVLVNHTEFDYLLKNGLYSLDGQEAFSRRGEDNLVDFPVNEGDKHGAIEIKLSWKELGPNDDPGRFYTTKASIQRSEPAAPGEKDFPPQVVTVGLVGMHVSMRTKSSPEWVWATFEQVDNVVADPHVSGKDGKPLRPNFNNPDTPFAAANVLPPKNAVLDPKTGQPAPASDPAAATTWIESLTTQPVQVTRVDVPTQGQLNPWDEALAKSTASLNGRVEDILRQQGSVFQYYKLIGTQWPIHPNAPAFAGGEGSAPESITHKTPGDMVPVFLVNTTMETYFQKGKQSAGPLEQDDRLAQKSPSIDSGEVIGTESCVGCHYSAGTCIGFKKDVNGNYVIDPVTGRRVAIFGENNHFGKTGNASFSWLLQIEGHAKPYAVAGQPAVVPALSPEAGREPARLLDIKKFFRGRQPVEVPPAHAPIPSDK